MKCNMHLVHLPKTKKIIRDYAILKMLVNGDTMCTLSWLLKNDRWKKLTCILRGQYVCDIAWRLDENTDTS